MSNRATPALMWLLLAAGNVAPAAATEQRRPEQSSVVAARHAEKLRAAARRASPRLTSSKQALFRSPPVRVVAVRTAVAMAAFMAFFGGRRTAHSAG